MRVRVLIRPKAGILDPQGQAVERALPAIGFEGVSEVRIGRLVELELEDGSRLAEMCETLLVNPLIEDYVIEEVETPAPESGEPGPGEVVIAPAESGPLGSEERRPAGLPSEAP